MALNANHGFEELNGIKCAVVEKNCSQERADFLKAILELNKYTVVVAEVVAKAAPAKPAATAEGTESPTTPVEETKPAAPKFFNVGVSDVSFSVMNAVFNRELKDPSGNIVTPAYWRQKSNEVQEQNWYWKKS